MLKAGALNQLFFTQLTTTNSQSGGVVGVLVSYFVHNYSVFRLSVLTAVTAVFVDDRGCENDFEHFEQILRYIFVIASLRRGGCHYVLFRHLALATSTGLNYECTDAPTDTRGIANLLQNETRQQMTLSEFVSKFARHCGIAAGWAGGWAVALWASACEQ